MLSLRSATCQFQGVSSPSLWHFWLGLSSGFITPTRGARRPDQSNSPEVPQAQPVSVGPHQNICHSTSPGHRVQAQPRQAGSPSRLHPTCFLPRDTWQLILKDYGPIALRDNNLYKTTWGGYVFPRLGCSVLAVVRVLQYDPIKPHDNAMK